MRGTVARMIRDRGFGFVRCDDGTEVFFHHSSLPRGVFDTIQEGQEMDFEIENDVRRFYYRTYLHVLERRPRCLVLPAER